MVNKIAQQITGSLAVVNATETVILTTNAYTYDYPNVFVGTEHAGSGQGVTISGVVDVNPVGTAGTAATIRVRQGSISGTVVGVAEVETVAAGNAYAIPYEALDTTRWAAQAGGGVWVVTIQFTAATANSTVVNVTADIEGA